MVKKYTLLFTIVNIVLYFVILALWISITDSLVLNGAVTSFNLILSMALLYFNREDFKVFYASHFFKKLTESLLFIFLIFCLLSLVNYWGFKHPSQVDTTLFKLNELSAQSQSVIKAIKGKVQFKIVARKQEGMLWLPLAELYRSVNNQIEIEKIDIEMRPDVVSAYQLTNEATLVIEYNNKRQFVTDRDELNITNALIKITRDHDPVVYFLTGHNEASLNSKETEGMKFIFEALKNSAIDARIINLSSVTAIPFDAKAVILWGPKTKLLPSEIQILEEYRNREGRFLMALDSDLNKKGESHDEIRRFIQHFGIDVHNDLVIDHKSFVNGSNGSIPLVESFNKDHPITKKFKGQIFFPLVASMELNVKAKSSNEKILSLFESSPFPDSWGETNIEEFVQGRPQFNMNIDRKGPLSLAMAYESEKNKAVIFGNSSFVLNAYMKYGNNFIMFINSLSWLCDEGRLISFNMPIIQSERLFISAPELGIIFYLTVLFIPLILIGLAIFVYRRRRVL